MSHRWSSSASRSLFFVRDFNYRTRLDEMEEGDDIQSYLFKKTNQRTVPNVFVGPCLVSLGVYSFKLTTFAFSFSSRTHRR